jgi:hypothetical protein
VGTERAEHYEVLGVDPSASMDEIRRSYLRLARTSHPDFHNGSEVDRLAAERRMRRINAAWAVLGDVDARSSYDRTRLSNAPRAPFHAGAHGRIDEPDPWRPFHEGPVAGFDEREDRPITSSALPSWMKTFPALGFLFGLAALLIGALVDLPGVAGIGLILVTTSGLLFLAAPLVALSMSKGQDRRP